jgi:hypothetical protein
LGREGSRGEWGENCFPPPPRSPLPCLGF